MLLHAFPPRLLSRPHFCTQPRLKPRPVQYMCVTREAHSFLCVPWPRTIVQRTVAGLDRGVAASEEEVQRVLQAVEALEAEASLRSFQEGPPLPGTPSSSTSSSSSDEGPYGLEAMQGLWRLVFSSGFAAGSLGGLRPGPPTGRLPILVGQVSPSSLPETLSELSLLLQRVW